jgi:hypothetical protein
MYWAAGVYLFEPPSPFRVLFRVVKQFCRFGRGGGEVNCREGRGALVYKRGRKYQHD